MHFSAPRMKTFHFPVTEGDQLVDINQSTSFKHSKWLRKLVFSHAV